MSPDISIPKIIHLIWFGSWPPKADKCENYLKNIQQWKILNPNFCVNLWTSDSTLTTAEMTEMRVFCEQNHIVLKNINEHQYQHYPNIQLSKEWLSSRSIGLPRFAAASDVLRIGILEQEGGHYFDLDIEPLATIEAANWSCPEGNYQLVNQYEINIGVEHPYFEYCIMGALPKNRLYHFTNLAYAELHNKYLELLLNIPNGEGLDVSKCIINATGPHLSLARKNLEASARREIRGDFRLSTSNQIVQGELKDKVIISFDRTYGREDIIEDASTKTVLKYFTTMTNEIYSRPLLDKTTEKSSSIPCREQCFFHKSFPQKNLLISGIGLLITTPLLGIAIGFSNLALTIASTIIMSLLVLAMIKTCITLPDESSYCKPK
jgi:hypothetical protein